ncbi:MAG: hypothetical protein IT577_24220 [Verrucomicrobiae bacterium]|nr:hypothetical protein [Verrucomicrobiae bacterium]
MDAVTLATLRGELEADCRVAAEALDLAKRRLDEGSESGREGCAHHLSRVYNIVERMAVRVASAFENQVDRDRGWHAALVRRMSIAIPGVRPALWSDKLSQPLRELRGFRHVFNHAYDLSLDPEKLALLVKYASEVVPHLETICGRFVASVAQMHRIKSA